MNVTKKYICKEITGSLDLSFKQKGDFLNAFIEIIKANSVKMPVKIKSFGTFYKHTSPKRLGRNPKTRKAYIIPPRDKIVFKSSNQVKNYIN